MSCSPRGLQCTEGFSSRESLSILCPLLGILFNYHVKYFVFGGGTSVINLHSLFSFQLFIISATFLKDFDS
jgi:hypothetical protein